MRSNRKNIPVAVTKAKLKPGECCFHRQASDTDLEGPMLALKLFDIRAVYMLSIVHSAIEKPTSRVQCNGTPVYKPADIVDYCKKNGWSRLEWLIDE